MLDREDQLSSAAFGHEEILRILEELEKNPITGLRVLGVLCIRDRGCLHSFYGQKQSSEEDGEDDE